MEVARNDIEIAVTQAYLEILYANETVKTNAQTVESSAAQMERSKAAARSRLDRPQRLRANGGSVQQRLLPADRQRERSGASTAAARKQLLELGIDSTFDVVFPQIDSSTVLAEVPRMEEVYLTALEVMPQMESGRLNIQSALALASGWPRPTVCLPLPPARPSGPETPRGPTTRSTTN